MKVTIRVNVNIGTDCDYDMNSFIEDFVPCIKSLSGNSNKYVIKLTRELPEYRLNKRSNFENGVFLCYKVRCSIVHAVASALTIDEFSDADDALRSLIIPLENAVMKYVGISTI
jgi:hypothetical protein